MLRFFAKFQRSRTVVLWAFCALLLVGLIAFYIPDTDLTGSGRYTPAGDEGEVVAKVGSQEITVKDFRKALANVGAQISRGSGNNLPLPTLRMMGADKQALDSLIAERLTVDEASKLNLIATDREISDFIVRTFTNENGQFIGRDEYVRRLSLGGTDVSEYEQDVRDEITVRKVNNYLSSAEQVSEKEVEEAYKKDNTLTDLAYAIVDRDKVKSKFKPTEQDLQAYYDQHKDAFKASEPTRKVDYIFVSTDQVAKTMTLTEQELREEYDKNKQMEYRASVIRRDVLSTDESEGTTVKNKIDEIYKRIKGAPNQPGEDFAKVARAESQDPSASKGGDLGFIRKDPNKSGQWRQRVFNSKVNDIDGPFRDGKSWYILKVTEERQVPFEDLRPTLRAGVANRKAYQIASQLADKAYEKATEYKDLKKAAAEIAGELKTTPEQLIKTTPFFKDGDTLPEIGSNPAFEEAVKDLKKNEIADKVGIPGGLAVPQAVEILAKDQQMTYDQARNQVEQKLRQEKEPNVALAVAQDIITKAKNADEFQKLAKAEGLEVKTDTNFNTVVFPGQAAGGLQTGVVARNALMSLKAGEVVKSPIKYGAAGYMIFAAIKRVDADLAQLAGMRDDLRQRLINERVGAAYTVHIQSARKRYEEAGKIKIYQDRIDKFFAAQPQ